MDEIHTCKICGRLPKPGYRFCYHCAVPVVDSELMSSEEAEVYHTALRRWCLLNCERLIGDEEASKDYQKCSVCKAGVIEEDGVCSNCGFISLSVEQISEASTKTLEKAAKQRRIWLRASGRELVEYGVDDYSNSEDFMRGMEEKKKQIVAALEKVQQWVEARFEEEERRKQGISDQFATDIMKSIRQDPNLRYESLSDEKKAAIDDYVRTKAAPSMVKVATLSVTAAQKNVEKIMYYGQEMILPDDPSWATLTEAQKSEMLARQKIFQEWRHRTVVVAFGAYCVMAAFLGPLTSLLAGSCLQLALTSIAVSWYSSKVDTFTRKAGMIFYIAGAVFLFSMTWLNRSDWIIAIGGALVFVLAAEIIHLLGLQLAWNVRHALNKAEVGDAEVAELTKKG